MRRLFPRLCAVLLSAFLLFGFAATFATLALVQLIEPCAGWLPFLGRYSLHIMLMGLKRVPKEGESVPMTLRFEHGGEVAVEFVVQRDGGAAHGTQPSN